MKKVYKQLFIGLLEEDEGTATYIIGTILVILVIFAGLGIYSLF